MIFKHLKFFDKKGNSFNWLFNGEFFEGSIFFPRTSVELIENEHIFIIEEFQNTGGTTKYGYPLSANITGSPDNAKWRVRWAQEDGDENFYFYQIEDGFVPEEQKSYPFIKKYSSLDSIVGDTVYSIDPITGRKVVTDLDLIESSSVSLNLAFTGKDEDIFERDLILEDISDPNHPVTIAKVHVYG